MATGTSGWWNSCLQTVRPSQADVCPAVHLRLGQRLRKRVDVKEPADGQRPTASASSLRPPRSRARPVVTSILCGALGLALLVLAVPRTIAAWSALGAGPALDKLLVDKSPYDAELAAGVVALERSISWTPSGRRLTDLALLEAVQAERLSPGSPRREELLAQSERHLVDGLIADPADGFAWLRLAVVRELRAAQSRQIAAALVQSLDVAPNMRRLWIPRAGMMLRYWQSLEIDELLEMRGQLRTIWTVPSYRQPLLQAADMVAAAEIVEWALIGETSAEAEYDQLRAVTKPP